MIKKATADQVQLWDIFHYSNITHPFSNIPLLPGIA